LYFVALNKEKEKRNKKEKKEIIIVMAPGGGGYEEAGQWHISPQHVWWGLSRRFPQKIETMKRF
jgi:hypothetical protein